MIKLYKRDESGKLSNYHEVWVEPENRRIIEHWGEIGDVGETESYRIKLIGSLEAQIERILSFPRAEGYEEIGREDQHVLVVEYLVDGFGDPSDLLKRHALEEKLNKVLGWNGLGHCDGGSIGSGSMEAACFVVDYDLAKAILEDALNDSDFSDYSRIYRE